MVTEIRDAVRVTIKRSNKLIDALSVPRMTVYNVRSAWAKWENMAEDMDTRSIDLSFYTEVWHKVENKKHQKAIENILEIKGIQYISTPRPGPRRGGGTALACSQQNFILTKLNIHIPASFEACFGLLKPKNPRGKVTQFICCSFYSPPHSKFRNKLAEFLVVTLGQVRTVHQGSRVIVAGDRNDMAIDLITTLDPTLKQVVRGYTNKLKTKLLDVVYTDCQDLLQEPSILPPMQVDEGKVGKDSDHCGVELLPRTNLAPAGRTVREKVTVRPYPESKLIDFGFLLVNESWNNLKDNMSSTEMVDSFVSLNNKLVDKGFPTKEI
jgi:hypothetical protein